MQCSIIIRGNNKSMFRLRCFGGNNRSCEKDSRRRMGSPYTKRSFFPYWRPGLQARFPVKVYPVQPMQAQILGLGLNMQLRVSLSSNSMASGSTPTPDHKLWSTYGQ